MKLLDGFCQMQCTLREIANYFNCSEDTIENRVRQVHGESFSEYFAKRRVTGLIALRRNLFRLSETNVAAAIFLAKNYLGMVDKLETDVTTKGESINTQGVTVKLAEDAVSVLRDAGAVRAIRAGAVSAN